MKKSKINQEKNMNVELMLMHDKIDRVINMNVKAKSKNEAKIWALKSVRDVYGDRAEALCEIRDIEIIG